MGELVHARGRLQIDDAGQDVDEISLRIDSGQCPTTSTSRVSSSILDAAIIKDVAKVGSSPNRVPRWLPGALAAAGSRRLPLSDEPLCVVAKSMIPKKGGNPWTTNPMGFPKQ
jgi:hypothetical protein